MELLLPLMHQRSLLSLIRLSFFSQSPTSCWVFWVNLRILIISVSAWCSVVSFLLRRSSSTVTMSSLMNCLANLGFALANTHKTSACFLRAWGTAVLFRLFALCLEVPHERCMSTAGQSLNECMCQLLVAYNLIKFYLGWALCLYINIHLLVETSVLTFLLMP